MMPLGVCGPVRGPNPSNANNVRNSNPDGSLNNNNANNTNGAAFDRENVRDQVDPFGAPKAKHSHRERASRPHRGEKEPMPQARRPGDMVRSNPLRRRDPPGLYAPDGCRRCYGAI